MTTGKPHRSSYPGIRPAIDLRFWVKTFQLHNRLYEAPPDLAGHTVEARFDPLDAAQVEIWFQGQLETTARPVDPVVNGQLPSAKPAKAVEPEPTGINFVELLKRKKDGGKDGQE